MYITDLQVSRSSQEEDELRNLNFIKINVDIYQGSREEPVYLWYKKGSHGAITRIQLTYEENMDQGLAQIQYIKIDKDLLTGQGSYPVNLWYYKGALNSDIPITELCITTDAHDEASKFSYGWERLAADLTQKEMGQRVYLWMRRESPPYICEVTATDTPSGDANLFQNGYIRMDVDTNKGAGGAHVFIWYLLTTDDRMSVTDLQISINDEQYDDYTRQGYKRVPVNLNKWTPSEKQYLWFKKKGPQDAIKGISMISEPASVEIYEKVGIQVIKKNIGKGAQYLCFKR